MPAMTVAPKNKRSSLGPVRFEDAARAVLREVQEAFARLVAAVPARPAISKAADLQKALGVDPKLGWLVYRVAKAHNPLAAGPDVPSRVSMQRLFKAAAKKRVPATIIDRASGAFDRFEELVAEHAGDRDSFSSMVSALTGGANASEEIDLAQRRAVFKGNSHIWGLQARSKIGCMIIQPSGDDPDFVDAVFLRGVVGLRQLRHDRPFTVSVAAAYDNDGVIRRHPDIERLDVVDDEHGINMLRDFCTQPLPKIRNYRNDRGLFVTQLINSDLGSGGAFTGFLCDVFRKGDRRYCDEHSDSLRLRSDIENPFEFSLMDTLIRRGTYGDRPLNFETKWISLVGDKGLSYTAEDVLFTDEPAAYLGLGADGLHLGDYPRYVEMIRHVMDRLGWDPAEFEAYRYRLAYPVMNSALIVECPLPRGVSGDAVERGGAIRSSGETPEESKTAVKP